MAGHWLHATFVNRLHHLFFVLRREPKWLFSKKRRTIHRSGVGGNAGGKQSHAQHLQQFEWCVIMWNNNIIAAQSVMALGSQWPCNTNVWCAVPSAPHPLMGQHTRPDCSEYTAAAITHCLCVPLVMSQHVTF